MTKIYLSNAFSLNMIQTDGMVNISVQPIEKNQIPSENIESAIGHPDTARVVSNELGFEIKSNRVTLKLDEGDVLYVAQYIGPRLPEGATKLPEGAKIKYLKLTYTK